MQVVIVYRALHILHEVLRYTLCTERKEDRRYASVAQVHSLPLSPCIIRYTNFMLLASPKSLMFYEFSKLSKLDKYE